MFISQKVISAPCDFNSKFVISFVSSIISMKSSPYIATLDKNIDAKSILGLLSADIKQGDDICIQTVNNYNQEQSDNDLNFVLSIILGDSNGKH